MRCDIYMVWIVYKNKNQQVLLKKMAYPVTVYPKKFAYASLVLWWIDINRLYSYSSVLFHCDENPSEGNRKPKGKLHESTRNNSRSTKKNKATTGYFVHANNVAIWVSVVEAIIAGTFNNN